MNIKEIAQRQEEINKSAAEDHFKKLDMILIKELRRELFFNKLKKTLKELFTGEII